MRSGVRFCNTETTLTQHVILQSASNLTLISHLLQIL